MNFKYTKEIFNKFKEDDNKVNKVNAKKIINLINLSLDKINDLLNEDKYSFEDIMKIIKHIIGNDKNQLYVKYSCLKKELESKIDKKTVEVILFNIYGNVNPQQKIDISKLEKMSVNNHLLFELSNSLE